MASEEELINIIQKLVEEKTFSMEGAKAIAELKRSAEANRQKLIDYEKRIDGYEKSSIEYIININELKKVIEGYKTKEKLVIDREEQCNKNELRVAVSEAKAYVMHDMFNTIFRNTIIRESVQKSVATEMPQQYHGQVPVVNMKQGDSEVKTTQKE